MSGFNPTPLRIKKAISSYQQHTTATKKPGTAHVPAFTAPLTPAPGAAPVPKPAPQPKTLPFDPVYEQTVSNNQQSYGNTLAGITLNENAALTDAGYIKSGDSFQLDPNNPFSKAALLQRHYDQSVKGSRNGLAAQGQLYSGALQNAQNENRFQFDQGSNANLSNLQAMLQELAARRTGALTDLNTANTGAMGTSIQNAQSDAIANRDTDAQLAADASQAPSASASLKPKAGFSNINTDPKSKHYKQSFNVTKDSKGRTVHVYANGERETLK